MANKKSTLPEATKQDVEEYSLLYPLLDSLLTEIKELSKKKQDGVLNEMKVKMANRIMSRVKTLLEGYPTSEFLDLLDTVKLPTNSDAVLIVAQFKTAMDQYRTKNTTYQGRHQIWNVHKDEK